MRAYRLVQETVLIRIIETKHDCKRHRGKAQGVLWAPQIGWGFDAAGL